MAISREQHQAQVQLDISRRAEQYGYKSSNLQELEKLCQKIQKINPSIKVDVPAIEPLSHDFIQQHLDKHAAHWKDLWNEFKLIYENEDKTLTTQAKKILEKLQTLILNTFTENLFNEKIFDDYFNAIGRDALLMVRSTGKEDNIDFGNQGGNESVSAVKANAGAISQAIGVVVASYFSEKSLSQRLVAKDDITKNPFMPVLLQKMIGEPLNGAQQITDIVQSGVMYTGKTLTHIQVAPGHGELVVNNKGLVDKFYVTREEVVYQERSLKKFRLVPVETEEKDKVGGLKRKLEIRKNPKELVEPEAISMSVAQRIAEAGRIIEEHYGMPMDVEFVYSPKQDQIFLVQARSLGKKLKVIPSSVPPEKMASVKKEDKLITDALIVTPGEFAAQTVTQKKRNFNLPYDRHGIK